ncbi:MAG: hypothetical protein MUC84_05310 [Solirubrobacteraceae bacterium]|jgi:hypothetical protein|nr:hypothetical protein [Solirubrobacteraceae bacterium]MCU0313464.1 hypothetical protein [Solirubrobacteraceae bacterium]
MKRAFTLLPAGLLAFLLLAPVAVAEEVGYDPMEPLSGEGLYGKADDQVVTNAGFLVIALFPTVILLMSLLQWRLDKRKERRKAAKKALGGEARWQSGW